MTQVLENPYLGEGILSEVPQPLDDPDGVATLLSRCPVHAETPLVEAPALAAELGLARLTIKDERGRMGLGSFKALGAAHAIARDCADGTGSERTYVAASAGNHGLSVAAGAAAFGARSVIYLAETVPEAFANRLRDKGATVRRAGAVYEDSMAAAEQAAADEGMILLSDSTWDGYTLPALAVMEGYLQLAAEVVREIAEPPSHIFLQAGVGGMAASLARYFRRVWGAAPIIVVVEPEAAPALIESIRARGIATTPGPVSAMGRLDCKTPSLVALSSLSKDADLFVTITETEAEEAAARLGRHGLATTPSGGAGLAAVMAGRPALPQGARVLAVLSEGPEDA